MPVHALCDGTVLLRFTQCTSCTTVIPLSVRVTSELTFDDVLYTLALAKELGDRRYLSRVDVATVAPFCERCYKFKKMAPGLHARHAYVSRRPKLRVLDVSQWLDDRGLGHT